MTTEEQAELKKILVALNSLINQLLPEDDIGRLALDPKRQASAARVVGTTALARDLIDRALDLCEKMPHPNGLPKQRRQTNSLGGKSGAYVLKRLERSTVPLTRPDLANGAVQSGACTANTTAYGAFKKLQAAGKITIDEATNTVSLVRP